MPERASEAELYDLQSDPGERRNLLSAEPDEEVKELARTLEKSLREYVTQRKAIRRTTEIDDETMDQLRALGYVK